jgi:hypothetical protein
MPWPVFWVDETGECELSLRRFTWSSSEGIPPCTNGETFHDASVAIGRSTEIRVEDEHGGHRTTAETVEQFEGDPRWPATCALCPFEFRPEDQRQVNCEPLYRRRDTGEEYAQRRLPTGALFDSWWAPPDWRGPDGRALTVVLPDLCEGASGDARGNFWNFDGPASGDGHLTPHAWTRHGDPDADLSTFSVTPSIDARGNCYHAHLTNGMLTDPG